MPDSPITAYTLVAWVRRGLASSAAPTASLNYATAHVALTVNGAPAPAPDVRLLGPGDIQSIDARAIIRTDPRDGVDNFEPNYLAAVEFGQPDFPWMFTPDAVGENGRLWPWLCLVVVPDRPGVSLTVRADRVAVLRLDSPIDPRLELPNLDEIDMWAHAQVSGEKLPDLEGALDGVSGAHLSRVLCPRRLAPGTRYIACVVPTYHAGVAAALGEPVDDHDVAPAWGPQTIAPLVLPMYYHFSFRTGREGDFASLAQQIRPPDPAKPPLAGARPMDLTSPGFGFSPAPPAGLEIGLEGALTPVGYQAKDWPAGAQAAFQTELRRSLTPPPGPDPVVTPPVYGRREADTDLPADNAPPNWLRELNLDPRARVAASAGAEVVRRDQEDLVASTWDQLGEIRKANQLLRQAQLARALSLSLLTRHLDTVADDGAYLQMTAPVHARVRLAAAPPSAATLRAQIGASRLPLSSVSPALRKLARPRGPLARTMRPTGGPSTLLARFNLAGAAGTLTPISVAAPEFSPAGMVAFRDAGLPTAALPPTPLSRSNLSTVLTGFGAQLNRIPGPPVSRPSVGGAPTLATPRAQLRAALDPEQTMRARLAARLSLPTTGDPLRPMTMSPIFPQAMYAALAEVGAQWMFPGIGEMERNTVALLQTNPPFVEAFLVGLNDEMSRELMWRDVPADLRATYFKTFWGTTRSGVAQPDIGEIASFSPAAHLGAHTADPAGGKLVLLIRAELFRRYPNALVSAVPAAWAPDKVTRVLADRPRSWPVFRGQIGEDVYFFGFDQPDRVAAVGANLPAPADPGWYFLLEEHPTEPRFGLEPAPRTSSAVPSWNDLSWTQIPADGNYLSATAHPPATPAGETIAWGSGPAEMAYILMRRPVRIAMHARALIGGH